MHDTIEISPERYFGILRYVLGDDLNLKEDVLNCDYKANFIIDPDGSVSTSDYIKKQGFGESGYIDDINDLFDPGSSKYQIAKLIIDKRQLNQTKDDIINPYDSKDIVDKLLKTDRFKPVVEEIMKHGEYFAVKKNKPSNFEKTDGRDKYSVVIPGYVDVDDLPQNIEDDYFLLEKIIPNLKPPVKRKFKGIDVYSIGGATSLFTLGSGFSYVYMMATDQVWFDDTMHFIDDIQRITSDVSISDIVSKYKDNILTKEGAAIIGIGIASALSPNLFRPGEFKTKIMKKLGRGKNINDTDLVEMLLEKYDISEIS